MNAIIPSSRREAREEALAVLYEIELTGDSNEAVLERHELPPVDYAAAIIGGVSQDAVELDAAIERNLTGWRLSRLAVVDLILARIATWELLRSDDVPTGVVLSEVVELATQYSGEESPRFLNGVMRAVANDLRHEADQAD